MPKFRFSSKNGKYYVVITLFTKNNIWLLQRSLTFDVKPTIKELKETYRVCKKDSAYFMRVSSGYCAKTYKL